jgi:ABC-type lipoprotein release transport system permease subunit
MEGTARGVIGLGVTLFVLAAGMAVVNGIARGWAAKTLATNPNSQTARAVLMLY